MGVNALILPFSLACREVTQGILLGPLAVLAVGLGPALLFLTGWIPVEMGISGAVPSGEAPTWALSDVQNLARRKGQKNRPWLLSPPSWSG